MSTYTPPLSGFFKGFITGGFLVAVGIWFVVLLSSCSMHTVNITPKGVNATSITLLYCPAEAMIKAQDGNRTADILSGASGVGAVVTEVLKP